MPAPAVDPGHRAIADIAPTDTYLPTDPVWIYRGGSWRPGVVEAASGRAATVTYRPNTTPATAADTLTAQYIAPRSEVDPVLDNRARQLRGGDDLRPRVDVHAPERRR
jgi:hypothetical protein